MNVYSVIDWPASLNILSGNETLARDLLGLLLNELQGMKPQITALVETKQLNSLGDLIHKLRGGSAYCGVPQLQQSCLALETAIKAKQSWEIIVPLSSTVIKDIDAVILEAPKYLSVSV